MSVLIVENEAGIRQLVRDQLLSHGVPVTSAATLGEATDAITEQSFAVVILDVTIPDGPGLGILDHLRQLGSPAHVIVLSGSSSEADRLDAFQKGADDYVVRPFYIRELVARVLAVRRRDPNVDQSLHVGSLVIDLAARQVDAGGRALGLTPKEFDLLAYLAARPGHIFSREHLLNAVWLSASDWQQEATVTEHIRRLRAKIEEEPGRPSIIQTVRGAGYRLRPPGGGAEGRGAEGLPAEAKSGTLVHVNGRIVSVDRSAKAFLGYGDEADLSGRYLLDFVAHGSLPAARARLAATDAGHERRSELLTFERPDGSLVALEVASSAVGWHGQPATRSSLKHIPDAAARLRRQVTGVLSDLTEAVIITDPHFHIRSWNTAAERLYGWTEQDALGRHLFDVVRWVGDGGHLAAAWESLEVKGRWIGEADQVARDGSVACVRTSMTLLRESGEALGVVAVNRLAAAVARAASYAADEDAEARLHRGIKEHQFEVYYQPVNDLVRGDVTGIEALVRWNDSERGVLAPADFLDAAERSGLIVDLGDLVLNMACRQAAEWRRGGADITLSVNLSTRELADPKLVGRIVEALAASGLDPAFLSLEITETSLVQSIEEATEALVRLVDLGIGVAIDDFGTGWASLTYLRSFPVTSLKIDRSFVAGVGHDPNDRAIVRSILSLGAELDLLVVAEGVETVAQQTALRKLGCSVAQGFLYGRPTPACEVAIHRARRLVPPTEATPTEATGSDDRLHDAGRLVNVGAGAPAVMVANKVRSSPMRAGPTRSAELSGYTRTQAKSVPAERPATSASERVEHDAVANLLRGLLRVRSARGATELLQQTILGMGATLVAATDASYQALPMDVSLGEGPPVLVEAEPFSLARLQLERLLPRLLEDTRQTVDFHRQTQRLEEEGTHDQLTGLENRRVLDRVLPRAESGAVVMIDLDHFKAVNDTGGHAAGDAVLAKFGRVLRSQVRAANTACRVGGEEFAVIVADGDVRDALVMVDRIRVAWEAEPDRLVTFSAGVAAVSGEGGTSALLSADRALYRAKELGRNRTELAGDHADSREAL